MLEVNPNVPFAYGNWHVHVSQVAALVPRSRLHLIRFHGVLAPNAKLRALVVPQGPEQATGESESSALPAPIR